MRSQIASKKGIFLVSQAAIARTARNLGAEKTRLFDLEAKTLGFLAKKRFVFRILTFPQPVPKCE
jgi:hypothetical protein